jgi:hypothetical protein
MAATRASIFPKSRLTVLIPHSPFRIPTALAAERYASISYYIILYYWRLMSLYHSAIQPAVSATTTVSTASELQTDPANGIPHSILCYRRLWCSSGRPQHQCSACFTSVCFSLSYTPSISYIQSITVTFC